MSKLLKAVVITFVAYLILALICLGYIAIFKYFGAFVGTMALVGTMFILSVYSIYEDLK